MRLRTTSLLERPATRKVPAATGSKKDSEGKRKRHIHCYLCVTFKCLAHCTPVTTHHASKHCKEGHQVSMKICHDSQPHAGIPSSIADSDALASTADCVSHSASCLFRLSRLPSCQPYEKHSAIKVYHSLTRTLDRRQPITITTSKNARHTTCDHPL